MMVRKCKEIIKPVPDFDSLHFGGDFDMRQNFVVSDLRSLKICLLLGGAQSSKYESMIHASDRTVPFALSHARAFHDERARRSVELSRPRTHPNWPEIEFVWSDSCQLNCASATAGKINFSSQQASPEV